MAQVALNGTKINQSVKNNYVRYKYRVYDPCRYTEYDEDGNKYCIPGYRYYTGYSNAIINGMVSCNNKVYINDVSVAKAGDIVRETWVNSGLEFEYISGSASPALNGSGNGIIENNANNKKVYINGLLVAVKGSIVNTHLSTTTELNNFVAAKVFIG